jgi:hypothetical protein
VLNPPADIIHGDRRRMLRCRAALELRFHYEDLNGRRHFGRGTTLDLSRSGIRFRCEGSPPPEQSFLEIRIEWPLRLEQTCPVELLVHGHLVRRDEDGLVLAVDRCEFRTAKERSFDELDLPTATYSLTA